MKKLFLILGAALIFNSFAIAQKQYASSVAGSVFSVNGTSTLHDWTMNVTNFNVKFNAVYANSTLANFDNVIVSVNTKDLKSTEGNIMDRKAYDALKADKYPTIKFTSTKTVSFTVTGSTIKGDIQGTLVLAGVSKTIDIPFTGSFSSTTIVVNGSKKIKMSDYGIEPPTAAFGTIKCGDEITLNFKIKLTEKQVTN